VGATPSPPSFRSKKGLGPFPPLFFVSPAGEAFNPSPFSFRRAGTGWDPLFPPTGWFPFSPDPSQRTNTSWPFPPLFLPAGAGSAPPPFFFKAFFSDQPTVGSDLFPHVGDGQTSRSCAEIEQDGSTPSLRDKFRFFSFPFQPVFFRVGESTFPPGQ